MEEDTQVPTKTQNGKGRLNTSRTRHTDQATIKREGSAGAAGEDKGREGCTNHIRIAIRQLSGVLCGNWIIV